MALGYHKGFLTLYNWTTNMALGWQSRKQSLAGWCLWQGSVTFPLSFLTQFYQKAVPVFSEAGCSTKQYPCSPGRELNMWANVTIELFPTLFNAVLEPMLLCAVGFQDGILRKNRECFTCGEALAFQSQWSFFYASVEQLDWEANSFSVVEYSPSQKYVPKGGRNWPWRLMMIRGHPAPCSVTPCLILQGQTSLNLELSWQTETANTLPISAPWQHSH